MIPTIHREWTAATTNTYAPSDLILVSMDSIRFHVHQGRLVAASINSFNGELPMPLVHPNDQDLMGGGTSDIRGLPVLNLPYIGSVLNILLYIIYNRAGLIKNPTPSLSDLSSTVLALKKYGVPLETSLSESSHLFELFSAFCSTHPWPYIPSPRRMPPTCTTLLSTPLNSCSPWTSTPSRTRWQTKWVQPICDASLCCTSDVSRSSRN